VDLVVMAPHNRGLIEAIRHPSVTQNVLAQGSAPVLAWPQHLSPELDAALLHTPGSLVIVPLDGSPRAEEALPLATELAARFGRNLLLLRVVPTHGEPRAGAAPDGEQVRGTEFAGAEVRAYLADVRKRLLGPVGGKVPVETMVKHGEPTGEIDRAAQLHPGSVVVMSTRGRGELARLVLGSVSEGVIRCAPTPVLIVPPKVATINRPRSLAQARA
jgi:nucleotide-binding universal stress UspA family protein